MRKKILFVHHATGVGGAPISMVKTIKCLDSSIYDTEVLLLKDSVVRQMLENEGIKVSIANCRFYRDYYHFFSHIEPAYYRIWEVRKLLTGALLWILSRYYFSSRLLSNYSFDLLHLNSSVLSDFLAAGARTGKVVMHIREPIAIGYIGIRRSIIQSQIRRYAAHVIAISQDNAMRLGLSDRVTVIYNFADINPNPTSVRKVKDKVALYLGGDSVIKGFLTVVNSLDYLDEDIQIWFCGYYSDDRNPPKALKRILADYVRSYFSSHRKLARAGRIIRTHPRAKVLGLRHDVTELISRTSLLISPFTVAHFSRPIIEAFANGRCAIGTNIQGMDELIQDGVNGLLIDANSPKELAKAINTLCSDIDLNSRMSTHGYERAKKLFSPSNVLAITKIYDQILS